MRPEVSPRAAPAVEAPGADDGATTPGAFGRLKAAHFHDYSPAAGRLWVVVAVAGVAALVYSVAGILQAGGPAWMPLLIGLALVTAAAWFPIEIPRTRYSVGAADLFIFTLLAVLGAPAAVLAAGIEGCIGAWRGSRRLSSRISSPAAAMAAMAVTGLLFERLSALLVAAGVAPTLAKALALLPVAVVPFVLTTLSLTALVTLKAGRWPNLKSWFHGLAWLAAVYLSAATLAGLVLLATERAGPAMLVVVGAATLAIVTLIRVSLAYQEAQRRAQELRLAEARHEAELNQHRFEAAFAHAAIGMAIVDSHGCIVQVNQALGDLLGRRAPDMIGQPFLAALDPLDPAPVEAHSRDAFEHQDAYSVAMDVPCRRADGSEIWVTLHCERFELAGLDSRGLIYQLIDITSRQLAESRLQHIAFHDSLTGLPNRAQFHEQLALALADGVEAKRFAVMFLDLDRFKLVNDSLGHLGGNEMLREVARRLQQSVRPSDVVARLGGDEFAVLLRGIRDHALGLRLAERMLASLSLPMSVGGTSVVTTASIGLTYSDLRERTADELLRDADTAMYEAKAAGRGRVAVFDGTMRAEMTDRLALEADFRAALARGELTLDFQPLFELEPARLFGFEALARWTHPRLGVIEPEAFVRLAEETGHVAQLTDWVIDRALEQLAIWQRQSPRAARLGVSVNISGSDLERHAFVDGVVARLLRHGIAPECLTLEITETVLMSQLETAREALSRLRAHGVKLAIDDFGTGYSSLAYLSRLPINYLKIDRSFICEITSGDEHVEIVRAVLTLGEALGKRVVAEGVETPEQLATLRRVGVDMAQGYHLCRPLRPEQVVPLL